uniref:Nudix hydrolase domain-containing protein n=1 Tax=Leersia perrieri TaxID=77586 RepID=A0A0D9WWT7_9ORYZ
MCDLVARTGRHQQRYEHGRRLVAGCVPFRYKENYDETSDDGNKKLVEVLMINSQSGPGLLFPKQLLGFYDFKSKTHQDEFCPEGMCRAAVFALQVKEELASWPEQSTRKRTWLTLSEAVERSRYPWVREALTMGFSTWLENWSNSGSHVDPSSR